jgi:hypothetical protein
MGVGIGQVLAASAVMAFLAAPEAFAQAPSPAERLAAARARLTVLEQRSSRVDDLNTIENLQRTFGYYFDKMLWEQVLDLFADDATLEIGSSGVYVGKASIRRYLYGISGGVEGPIEGVLFEHMQLQPIVTVADDGMSAKGRWRALIMTGVSGSGSGGNWGEGPYENEYVKDDGIWKIAKLHWYGTFYVPYEGGWLDADPADFDAYSAGGGTTPDEPPSVDYAPYPATFTPPFSFDNPGRAD